MSLAPGRATPILRRELDPAAAGTLAAVELVLADRLETLAREWHQHGAGDDAVLGDLDVPELLASLVLGGGKRLRPLMCHWGWVAAGGRARGLDPAGMHQVGAALELLHAFGLAQDDVMDGSPLRRGRPAVHVLAAGQHRTVGGGDDADRFGESIAVLVGDLGHAEADALVAALPRPVQRLWWHTSVELVRGQARDLSSASAGHGTIERAAEVAHAKTGAYTVQRPLLLGATLADASPALLEALSTYGRRTGEAFALRDDLLGVFGDPDVTGKPVSDDLRDAKATVLLALAEQRCTGAAAAAVSRVRAHAHSADDIDLVRRAMVDFGVRDEAERRVARAVDEALASLDTDLIDPVAAEGLSAVATDLAWRNR